ncbi:hypothetical protein EYR38_010736 [Pleurotus pulmonarius]|nr:hypothetical protein EYR38_010736 [Pleurotus pulmonarius]
MHSLLSFWKEPDSRLYFKKIYQKSSRFANWEPARRIELGDYGTLNKRTGEFLKDGSIFSHPATKEHAAKLTRRDWATDSIQEYISFEASRLQFESGPEIDVSGLAAAEVALRYRFKGGRGAILVMHRPHPKTLEGDLKNLPAIPNKHIVTSVVDCPDYYMFLSHKEVGDVSLILRASAPAVPGVAAGGKVGGGWQHIGLGGTCKASQPGNEYTPLYETRVWSKLSRLRSDGEDLTAEEGWVPTVPPWKTLDSDGEIGESDSDDDNDGNDD